MSKEISRRDFLKGAAAGALTAALAGATSGIAFAEDAPTAAEEKSTTWYDAKYFAKPDPITDIAETVETDVVVVGAGNGGLVAAASAADLGAKVTLIEKNAMVITWAGEMGAYNTKLMNEQYGISYTDEELLEISNEICRYAGYECDQRLINLWLFNSGRTMDWFIDQMERKGVHMFLETDMKDCRFMNKPQTHTVYETFEELGPNRMGSQIANPKWVEIIEEKGGTIMWEHTAKQLIQDDDGRVTGIIAQDQVDQHYVRINASKGVIMCTGGYATNTDMMLALQPQTMKMKVNVPIGSKADGSGIKAMLWAGGEMDPCHASMMFNRASVLPTETAGYKTNGKWFWFGEQPFLKVNLNGKRFCNESGPYEFMLHSMYMQPYHTYCDIFDSNSKAYAEQFDEVGCCRLFPFDNGALSNRDFDGCWKDMMEGENSHLETGYLQKADTIEELAEKLNIPADALAETVARYNELCEKGVDEDYGKEKHRMTPVNQAPFYGIRTAAWHLTTLDGCRINTEMQVIREDGTPIEGLYATGDCTGGFFANNYPNLFTGLACGRTMTFGRLAAKKVAHL